MCDLTNLNMNLSYLSNASFKNCKMTGIVIENNEKVIQATFNKIDASDANFSNTILIDSKFETVNLERANLSSTCLTGVIFSNVNLRGACLSGVVLRDAKLSKVNLEGADLTDANLSGASFEKVNFSGAKLAGVIEASFSKDRFEGIIEDYGVEDDLKSAIKKVKNFLCLLGNEVLLSDEGESQYYNAGGEMGQGLEVGEGGMEEVEEEEEIEEGEEEEEEEEMEEEEEEIIEELDEAGVPRIEPIQIELEKMLEFSKEEVKDVPLSDDQIKEMLGFSDMSERSSAHKFLTNLISTLQNQAIIEQINILITKIEEVEDRMKIESWFNSETLESWNVPETAESLMGFMNKSDEESEGQVQKRKRDDSPPPSLESPEGRKFEAQSKGGNEKPHGRN
jgi:uncharacterized protein YjbI with pentapeptide repeats